MKKTIYLITFLSLFFLTGCADDDPAVPGTVGTEGENPFPENQGAPILSNNDIVSGGPGKDGIPSIDQPDFAPVASIDFLDDDDLVVGVKQGDIVRAYPHPVLDWHEIVNDKLSDLPLALTYCPLTGTGIGWERKVGLIETTFGVSGLLLNNNLIPYDRRTDSNWSQMGLEALDGQQSGNKVKTVPVVETNWASWQEMYPNSEVLTTNTGFDRNYDRYPYGDYRTNHELLLFPVSVDDRRLPRKERVLGVIANGKAKAYRFNNFSGNGIIVIQDNAHGVELVIAGSQNKNFLVAYERKLDDGAVLEFTAVQNSGPVILQDNEGNQWNVFGEAVAGPRTGEKLPFVDSFIGYWFAWGTFYPGLEIYD